MDYIFIDKLIVETTIGILEWERLIKQKLILDLQLGFDFSKAVSSDNINDTLDYALIAETISEYAFEHSHLLLESFAENIAKLLQEKFKVLWLSLKVTKPAILKNAEAVGIKIERGTQCR